MLKDQLYSLLRKKACVDLGLIARIGEVNAQPENFIEEFPQLLQVLGKLTTEYQIKENPEVKPMCLYTPRKIPHQLYDSVGYHFCNYYSDRVVLWHCSCSKSQWASTDLCGISTLNKAVQCEIHTMGSVDESLAMLGESRVFRSSWQIPLDDDSTLLTTFSTTFGHYCFNRLPFGISSAPGGRHLSMEETK